MKKILFLLTIALVGSLWAADDVTVQVISAVYEKSVTKELDANVKKTGLEVHKKIEDGRYVVTLGTFKSERDAQKALKKARHWVSSDAFVRLVERHAVATAHTPSISPAAHSSLVLHTQPHTQSTAVVEPKTLVVSTPKPASPSSATVVPNSTIVVIPAKVATTLSECDKREMHKNEFSEAINYYKNSPYHRFEPVALRQ